MHETRPPNILCRKRAFSDARRSVVGWGGGATFGQQRGVRSGAFIPLLTHPLLDAVGRWPWDVVIDAPIDVDAADRRIIGSAELAISLGTGAVAGVDCDLVIETMIRTRSFAAE